MAHIICWRSGEVEVKRSVPRGAVSILEGHGTHLKRILGPAARHAYDGVTLLVPGVPEAESDDEAIEAVNRFQAWLERGESLRASKRVAQAIERKMS